MQLAIEEKPDPALNESDQSQRVQEPTVEAKVDSQQVTTEKLDGPTKDEQVVSYQVDGDQVDHKQGNSDQVDYRQVDYTEVTDTNEMTESKEIEASTKLQAEPSSNKQDSFDPEQALRRVGLSDLSKTDLNTELVSSESTDGKLNAIDFPDLDDYLSSSFGDTDELIVLSHGNKRSLCIAKDLGSSSFSNEGSIRLSSSARSGSPERLYNEVRHMAIPLYRDQLISMISRFRLRLPQVWELQALYASGELPSNTVYWTRNSRQHLWSPTEGKWRSVSQDLKVKLALFFGDDDWDSNSLIYHEYTEIDALTSLENLASQTMKSFDFGLNDLGVFDEATPSDVFDEAQSMFELSPKGETEVEKTTSEELKQEQPESEVGFVLEVKKEPNNAEINEAEEASTEEVSKAEEATVEEISIVTAEEATEEARTEELSEAEEAEEAIEAEVSTEEANEAEEAEASTEEANEAETKPKKQTKQRKPRQAPKKQTN